MVRQIADLNVKRCNNFYCIFVYDNCSDGSAKLLNEYKNIAKHNVIIYHNIGNKNKFRTVIIANSRNIYINILYNQLVDIDYHIVIDADNLNENMWNTDIILQYMKCDDWDCLSFNRLYYYDIWALMYDNYKHHCWGFNDKPIYKFVVREMRNDIKKNF